MHSILRAASVFTLAAGLLAVGIAATAAEMTESYETRGWTYASGLQVSVVGMDTAFADAGTHALKLHFDCTTPGNWGIVYTTPDFPLEAPAPLATGFSIRVYLEPIGSATGQPVFKLAMQGAGEYAGGDILLTAGAWTDVAVPAGNVSDNFRQVKFIIGSNGATGEFNLYVDSLKRDGVLIDNFEPGFAGQTQLVNTEGPASSAPGDVRHLASSPVAAGPSDGAMAFAAQWTGDANSVVEIQHNFSPAGNLSTNQSLAFDIYVPTGTNLPTIGAFFWDGSNGFGTVGAVSPTANDAWQRLSIDISGLGTAPPPFNAANVQELKLVMTNISASGQIYLDNLQLSDTPVPVELSEFAAE